MEVVVVLMIAVVAVFALRWFSSITQTGRFVKNEYFPRVPKVGTPVQVLKYLYPSKG
jgi:hypothetical protein